MNRRQSPTYIRGLSLKCFTGSWETNFMVLLASFRGKFLILLLLMKQLMHRACYLPLCCMMYHQPCKMSPDQCLVCSSEDDTHAAGHLVLGDRGQRDVKPPGITQVLADFVWRGVHAGMICPGSQPVQLCLKPVAWAQVSDSRFCAWTGRQGSVSLSTNKGVQQAPSFHFPKNQKS